MEVLLDGITKTYKNFDVFENLNLDLTRISSNLIIITGKSGIGKTTLLNILALLDDSFYGIYKLENKNVKALTDRESSRLRGNCIGYIQQHFSLLEEETVFYNMKIRMIAGGFGKKNFREKCDTILEQVGLSRMSESKVNTLSGGQRQRLIIARALVNDPKYIIADEPFSGFDLDTKEIIIQLFLRLLHQGRKMIIVTHDDIDWQYKSIKRYEFSELIKDTDLSSSVHVDKLGL